MSATWGEDPKPPILIHISIAQKAAILDRVPRLLVAFDYASGDFWLKTHAWLRFRVIQHPDRIHPRELTVPEDAEKKGLIELGWFGSLDDPIPPSK